MSIQHYIKSTANYLTMWRRAIKCNTDNVGTDVFLSVVFSVTFQTFQIHYFTVKNSKRELLVVFIGPDLL